MSLQLPWSREGGGTGCSSLRSHIKLDAVMISFNPYKNLRNQQYWSPSSLHIRSLVSFFGTWSFFLALAPVRINWICDYMCSIFFPCWTHKCCPKTAMSTVEPSDPCWGLGTDWAFQALGQMMKVEGDSWLNSLLRLVWIHRAPSEQICDSSWLEEHLKNSLVTHSSSEVEGNIKSFPPAQAGQVQKGPWSCVFSDTRS